MPLLAFTWVTVAVAAAIGAFVWGDGGVTQWVLLAATVVALGLALPPIVSWRFRLYVLTTERIVVREGVISRGGVEIPLESNLASTRPAPRPRTPTPPPRRPDRPN